MRAGNTNKKKGFTLIELLVVISIIALLLSILMPALQKVKWQAKKVTCGSQLHQMHLALGMYAHDWRDKYPSHDDASADGGPADGAQGGPPVAPHLYRYYNVAGIDWDSHFYTSYLNKNADILFCPAVNAKKDEYRFGHTLGLPNLEIAFGRIRYNYYANFTGDGGTWQGLTDADKQKNKASMPKKTSDRGTYPLMSDTVDKFFTLDKWHSNHAGATLVFGGNRKQRFGANRLGNGGDVQWNFLENIHGKSTPSQMINSKDLRHLWPGGPVYGNVLRFWR